MSEAAHVPFTETKAPESAERLHRGALGLIDISASTMANIGPAYSFYFGFAGIVIAAGLASPLVVVAAIVAIALLGNTLSQFSRAQPSTGGFITFVGKTFGGTSAVTTALVPPNVLPTKVMNPPVDGWARENWASVLPSSAMAMAAAMIVSGAPMPAVITMRPKLKKKL